MTDFDEYLAATPEGWQAKAAMERARQRKLKRGQEREGLDQAEAEQVRLEAERPAARAELEQAKKVAENAMAALVPSRIRVQELELRRSSLRFQVRDAKARLWKTSPAQLQRLHRWCVQVLGNRDNRADEVAALRLAVAALEALALEVDPDLERVERIREQLRAAGLEA